MTLIVHVPHASTYIPADVVDQFILSANEIHDEALISADLYTDILARSAWSHATIVSAEVSRIVVDVERYSNDADEIMSQVGRGMIYSTTHNGLLMRRSISNKERKIIQNKWYEPHWKKLSSLSTNATVIDLHSYPLVPWKVELDQMSYRPEIDIGTDPRLTPQPWQEELKCHFERHGYSVGINTPYQGVIDSGSKYAVMIEIRRDALSSPNQKKWEKMLACLSEMPMP